MYRTCIFCSARLGGNESLEEFPVGRRVAFDASKGRLWAVCSRCHRWNLAPLEERWEAVESAERLFVDARTRVQSENIGLAKMPDGTALIRIGKALPGELAAWRYGAELARRRYRWIALTGAVVVGVTAWGGLALAGALGGAGGMLAWVNLGIERRRAHRVVYRVPGFRSPTGDEVPLRRHQLNGLRLAPDEAGELAVHLPLGLPSEREKEGDRKRWLPPRQLVLSGLDGRAVLGRALVESNRRGGTRRRVATAVELISREGEAETFLRSLAATEREIPLARRLNQQQPMSWRQFAGTFRNEKIPAGPTSLPKGPKLAPEQSLALEIALNDRSERRAMEGELAELEAAWREAEEIADIADRLPQDPLTRLISR
jgi:hypothetical protein